MVRGAPGAYVVYPDTRVGEEVAEVRIVPRDDPALARMTVRQTRSAMP